jgi:hypothetical protein
LDQFSRCQAFSTNCNVALVRKIGTMNPAITDGLAPLRTD